MEFLVVIYNNKDKTYRNVRIVRNDSCSIASCYIYAKRVYLRENEVITNIIQL